jgi:hypothetical protein
MSGVPQREVLTSISKKFSNPLLLQGDALQLPKRVLATVLASKIKVLYPRLG